MTTSTELISEGDILIQEHYGYIMHSAVEYNELEIAAYDESAVAGHDIDIDQISESASEVGTDNSFIDADSCASSGSEAEDVPEEQSVEVSNDMQVATGSMDRHGHPNGDRIWLEIVEAVKSNPELEPYLDLSSKSML